MMVFYPRGRQPYSNVGPTRRDAFMFGPPRGRGYAPPPAAPIGRRGGQQNPYLGSRSYGQWNQSEWEQPGQVQQGFGQGGGMNNLMGHVNNLSTGLNMLSQLGSVMSSFRVF